MTFNAAFKSRMLVGSLRLSTTARSVQPSDTVDMLPIACIEDTAKKFMPGRGGTAFTFDLMFDVDSSAGGQYAVLTAWKATDPLPMTWAPSGLTRGSEAMMVNGLLTTFTPSDPSDGVAQVALNTQSTDFTDFGLVLEDETAITADTNGTATDNAAATSNGGVAHLHVTAFSGLTSDAIIIEHSTNNSVWATLGTFTTVTALTSQRLVIAAGTTVNRYLRVSDDVTGTGSCTRSVSFARR